MNTQFFLITALLAVTLTSHAKNMDPTTYDPDGKILTPPKGIQVIPSTKSVKTLPKNGYTLSESTNPRELLKIKQNAPNEIQENEKNTDPYDTYLKASINKIKLAFPYEGIPTLKHENIIGYAAAGGYSNGWTGIKEFFSDRELGVCSLTLYNIVLSKGGAILDESSITHEINKKPTSINIEGSDNSGFMYTLAWYDNTFVHLLECANMIFDKNIKSKMIDYGVLIDNSLKTKG